MKAEIFYLFEQKYGLSVHFLTYNGLLSAIPDAWKRAIFTVNTLHA